MEQPLAEQDYRFIFDKIPRLCVDLIICSEDGLLLSLRDIEPEKGVWHLPGGMVHKYESIQEAAKRIGLRETGLEVEVQECVGYMEFPNEKMTNFTRHSVSIVLLAKVAGGDLKSDFQSKELRYFKTAPDKIYSGQEDFVCKYAK